MKAEGVSDSDTPAARPADGVVKSARRRLGPRVAATAASLSSGCPSPRRGWGMRRPCPLSSSPFRPAAREAALPRMQAVAGRNSCNRPATAQRRVARGRCDSVRGGRNQEVESTLFLRSKSRLGARFPAISCRAGKPGKPGRNSRRLKQPCLVVSKAFRGGRINRP